MTKTARRATLLFALLLTVAMAPAPASSAARVEDSWTTLPSIPTGRTGLGLAVVEGKIYAIGGLNDSQSRLGTNEMYDPETGNWLNKTSMPTPRSQFAISVYQNKIYVIGGLLKEPFIDRVRVSDANEVYDPFDRHVGDQSLHANPEKRIMHKRGQRQNLLARGRPRVSLSQLGTIIYKRGLQPQN